MSRSRQTAMNISNALRTINSSIVPEDCATDVYYDRVGRLWYAQFLTVTGHQVGWLGCGESPLSAVQSLMELNKPKKQGKTLRESSYE